NKKEIVYRDTNQIVKDRPNAQRARKFRALIGGGRSNSINPRNIVNGRAAVFWKSTDKALSSEGKMGATPLSHTSCENRPRMGFGCHDPGVRRRFMMETGVVLAV
ncbi:MAG: hypothetical protein CMJ48_13870, partial [Planctomycetaceae bacterium]|nr:hypothetical protein [Planctomycetaceae bacterium]